MLTPGHHPGALPPLCLLALLLLGVPAGVAAQEVPAQRAARADSVGALDLPDAVAAAVVDFFNDPRRKRFEGPTRIAADDEVQGDVAVLEGPFTVAGRVRGSVVAVNSDVVLEPDAAIDGDLLVVGGEVKGVEQARVGGEILVYPERLRYRREGRRIERVAELPRPGAGRAAGHSSLRGRSDFLVSTGRSYNRVEGLPITFGPRVETEGANPLRLHALAVYRTEAGMTLDTERMGYHVQAEQFLGGRRTLRVGAAAHSLVEPIEEWHLSDLENGLATFLFHRDFRDYYEREGVSAFGAWEPRRGPLKVQAEVGWERHASLAPGSPWTLFGNADPWRAQPLVAEGEIGRAALVTTLDTRNLADDPSTGWYARGRVERAFAGRLTRPRAYDPEGGGASSALLDPLTYEHFTTGILDLRRYNRVDPRSRLNLRLLAAGSLNGSPLPPQRQHALGGEGSLPAYELFSLDCGARERLVYARPAATRSPADPAYYARYGCDGFAMAQVEYRGKLAFHLHWDDAPWDNDRDEDEEWGVGWDLAPDWSFFLDVGRAWTFGEGRDEDLVADVGVGLLVNRLGIYLAKPLTAGRGLNLFVRIGPRF